MLTQDIVSKNTPTTRSPWRSVGVWLSLAIILYTLSNVIRAVLNPSGFAEFFYGMPLATDNSAFVLVYAVRTLFLGLFGLALLLRKDIGALSIFTLVAIVMPLGDAALVAYAGGPFTKIALHLLIAVIIFVTWLLLQRWLRSTSTG